MPNPERPIEPSQGVRKAYYRFIGGMGVALLLVWLSPYAIRMNGYVMMALWCAGLLILAVGSYLFRCKECDQPIVVRKYPFWGREVQGYQQFPGKSCSNCGALL